MPELRSGKSFVLTQSEAFLVLGATEKGNLDQDMILKLDSLKHRAIQIGLDPADIYEMAVLVYDS